MGNKIALEHIEEFDCFFDMTSVRTENNNVWTPLVYIEKLTTGASVGYVARRVPKPHEFNMAVTTTGSFSTRLQLVWKIDDERIKLSRHGYINTIDVGTFIVDKEISNKLTNIIDSVFELAGVDMETHFK